MSKKIFVKVTGLHNIFNVSENTYDISELKSSVTTADENSIIFITADSTDEQYNYSAGSTYIWTHGELFNCNDSIIPILTTTASSTITIDPYKMYNFGTINSAITIAFNSATISSNYCQEYMFQFVAGANCSITLPNTVKYSGGEAPTFVAGHTYEYNITNNLVVVGEFY